MDPSQVGLGAVHESMQSIHKDGVYPFLLQAAGLAHTEDAFDDAILFFCPRSKTALAPQHCVPQGPLRVIIGRRYSLLLKEEPEMFQFTAQKAGGVASISTHKERITPCPKKSQ
jgi:hypothetical protein